MSDISEKLKRLLFDVPCESECEGELGSCPDRKYGKCKRMDRLEYCTVQKIADHLLANGVTVQEWIPVSERLPEKECDCLIYTTIYFIPDHVDECDHYNGIVIAGYHPKYGFMGKGGLHAKAWMPLPQPPKGE